MAKRPISNENQIGTFLHCGLCIEQYEKEKPDVSRRDYARVEVGFTPIGLQVWCLRHDVNIVHIDFEGKRHPANQSRKP